MRSLICFLACTTFAAAAAAAPRSPDWKSCPLEGTNEPAQCGTLWVPENPEKPEGRRIPLNIVRLRSSPGIPAGAPLFDLAGGPGLAATGAAAFYATDGRAYRSIGDVVLVDQRGTGQSSPLTCPELEALPAGSRMYPPAKVRECRERLSRTADLAQYTTRNAALDLDAVRNALGYERVSLLGLSYGTRLAQAYIAMHPSRVRAAVLIGATTNDARLPLWHARHAQETLEAVLDDCARDAACARAFPDLKDQWSKAAAILNGHTGPASDIHSSAAPGGPLLERFRSRMATTSGQRQLPALIQRLAGGEIEPLLSPAGGASGIAEGLYLAVTCTEDTPWITPDQRKEATVGTFLGTYRIDEQTSACREWNVPRGKVPAVESTEVPLLLLAGDRDYVTPPRWAHQIARGARTSRVVVIPGLGHFPEGLTNLDCLDQMIHAFLRDPQPNAVNDACVATMHPPAFTLTAQAPKTDAP